MKALAEVLSAHQISRVDQVLLLSQPRMLDAAIHLKKGLESYFGNPRNLLIMRKDTGSLRGSLPNVVRKYCAKHLWREMWVEYWDQLLGAKLENLDRAEPDKLTEFVTTALKEAASVLHLRETRKLKQNRAVLWSSHLAAMITGKGVDENENRPGTIRDAFNSPFAPFVLASTSIGEEGLDFHRYCRRQIHWDPPPSGSSLAQRVGRVVRFRGLLQRRELAATAEKHGFIWIEAACGLNSDGLVPNFQGGVKGVDGFPRILIFALPFTGQFAKAKEVIKHFGDLKYFVGMTSDQLAKLLPKLVDGIDEKLKRELFNYVIDLRPTIVEREMKLKRLS